ncbi:MAG: S-layer homology domain-containing protein [Monoglobaceae bacterium]
MKVLFKKCKSKIKKAAHQIGAISLAVCIGLTSASVFALTDPDNREIFFQYSYSDSLTSDDGTMNTAVNGKFGAGWYDSREETGLDINSSLHGGVLKIPPADIDVGTAATIYTPKDAEVKPYVLSFDFLVFQDNVRYYMQINDGSKAFTGFVVGSNGYCGFVKDGGWFGADPTETSSAVAGSKYETGKWYTADIVVDPTSETSLRQYYINGRYLGESSSAVNVGNAMVSGLHILTGASYIKGSFDSTHDSMLIDNVRMNYIEDNSFYTRVSADGSEVVLNLSETPAQELKNIDIYDGETGDKIPVSNIRNCGKTVVFTADSQLKDGRQYTIVYPEGFWSVSGNIISDRYVYFYSSEPEEPYIKSAVLTDYFGKESGPYENISVIQSALEIRTEGGAVDADSVYGSVSLSTADGMNAELSDAQVTANGIKFTLNKFLKKSSEYILTVNGLKAGGEDVAPYKTRFFTTDEEIDGFFPIKFMDSYGDEIDAVKIGKVFASTQFINTSDTDKSALITLASYKKCAHGLELMNLNSCAVDIPAGMLTKVGKGLNEVSLLITKGEIPDVIKGYIWTSDEDKSPSVEASSLPHTENVPLEAEIGAVQIGDKEIAAASDVNKDGAAVSVAVIKKGEKYRNDAVYVNQLISDANKRASVAINMRDTDNSGDYTVEFACGGEAKSYDFVYINPSEFDEIKKELDAAAEISEAEVLSVIKDGYSKLGISHGLYSMVKPEQAVKLFTDELRKSKFNDSSWEQGRERSIQLFYIAAAANGSIDNVFDYKSELKLENESEWGWYSKNFVKETMQKDITARLKREYSSKDDFYDEFKEAYVLAVVKNPDGVANLRDVLQYFAKDIGISDSGKDSTYRALSGESFADYSELKRAFDKLETTSSTGGGGGGGGGRGSSGSFTGDTLEKKYENTSDEQKTVEPMLKDIFDDLDGFDWAKQAIVYLAEKRIVTGKDKTKFCPGEEITREEFVAMLVRAFAENADTSDVEFTDAREDAWYSEYLGKAISCGIVKGNDDGSFGIGQLITRQDMVVMLNRAAAYAGIIVEADSDETAFADNTDIAEYAKDAVYAMKTARIVNGITAERFAPLDNASRAEAAKVIFGLLNI